MFKNSVVLFIILFFQVGWGDDYFDKLLKEAENGNWSIQFSVAYKYDEGDEKHGVQKDKTLAIQWYEKSANQGCKLSLLILADKYAKGEGVLQDYSKTIEYLKRAAELGSSRAMYKMGCLYYEGTGVPKNGIKAKELFNKASELENSDAQFMLGIISHEDGDMKTAFQWFKKSGENGSIEAQNNIGLMYLRGEGTVINYINAYVWISIASANGDEDAKRNLNILSTKMTKEQIAEAQKKALELYELIEQNKCRVHF